MDGRQREDASNQGGGRAQVGDQTVRLRESVPRTHMYVVTISESPGISEQLEK